MTAPVYLKNLVSYKKEFFHSEQDCAEQNQRDRKDGPGVLHETCNTVAHERYGGYQHCIGKLRGHMVDVVTLCTGGGHNCGVGDRRTVVSADCAGQACSDSDDQKVAGQVDAYNDREQDSERSPGSSCGEGQENCYQKDNGREHAGKSCSASFEYTADIFRCAQLAGQTGQSPCESQNEDRTDHGFESFRKSSHTDFESKYFPAEIEDDRD